MPLFRRYPVLLLPAGLLVVMIGLQNVGAADDHRRHDLGVVTAAVPVAPTPHVERVNQRPTGDSRGTVTGSSPASASGPRSTQPRQEVSTTTTQTTMSDTTWPASYLPCGGTEYPPCLTVQNESGGDYQAFNPTGCDGRGCYGKWQFSGEWAGELGLPLDLSAATPQQQDAAARLLWNHGAGCSNWSAC